MAFKRNNDRSDSKSPAVSDSDKVRYAAAVERMKAQGIASDKTAKEMTDRIKKL